MKITTFIKESYAELKKVIWPSKNDVISQTVVVVVSLVFVFIHYPLIELTFFIIGLIIPRIVVEVCAKKMAAKYADMKKKYDHVQEKNKNKTV